MCHSTFLCYNLRGLRNGVLCGWKDEAICSNVPLRVKSPSVQGTSALLVAPRAAPCGAGARASARSSLLAPYALCSSCLLLCACSICFKFTFLHHSLLTWRMESGAAGESIAAAGGLSPRSQAIKGTCPSSRTVHASTLTKSELG